jgi:hypothetical protein
MLANRFVSYACFRSANLQPYSAGKVRHRFLYSLYVYIAFDEFSFAKYKVNLYWSLIFVPEESTLNFLYSRLSTSTYFSTNLTHHRPEQAFRALGG